jgi:phosphohistidine phosphatase
LNERGRRDAPAAGRWLSTHTRVPDIVVRSPAVRVEQTWNRVAGELAGLPKTDIVDPRIYEASTFDLLEVISEFPEHAQTVLLIGHNPGLVDLATIFAQTAGAEAAEILADKFSTSAIAVFDVAGDWQSVRGGHLRACAIPRG